MNIEQEIEKFEERLKILKIEVLAIEQMIEELKIIANKLQL
jgi:hypothetical protein